MRSIHPKIKVGLIIVGISILLSSCGRKERPTAPDPQEATYPRSYPTKE